MLKATQRNIKLVALPEELVARLSEAAKRHKVSLSDYSAMALEQAARVEEIGASLEHAVDVYELYEIQKDSGAVQIACANLDALVGDVYRREKDEMLEFWREAGRWYGDYLNTRLGDRAMGILQKNLKTSWNLDEVEIFEEVMKVIVKFVSFTMSVELTDLLVRYITGVMDSFGYEMAEDSHVRGLVTLTFKPIRGV